MAMKVIVVCLCFLCVTSSLRLPELVSGFLNPRWDFFLRLLCTHVMLSCVVIEGEVLWLG